MLEAGDVAGARFGASEFIQNRWLCKDPQASTVFTDPCTATIKMEERNDNRNHTPSFRHSMMPPLNNTQRPVMHLLR